jgi:hypothetical protein
MLERVPLGPLDIGNRLQVPLSAFMLSREAMRCTVATLSHYRYTAGGFVAWLAEQGAKTAPDHIRAYLVSLQERKAKDTTQHAHACGVTTWL